MIYIFLWRMVDAAIYIIGPFVFLGTIFGSKITRSDNDKSERIIRYKKTKKVSIIAVVLMSMVCLITFLVKVVPAMQRHTYLEIKESKLKGRNFTRNLISFLGTLQFTILLIN